MICLSLPCGALAVDPPAKQAASPAKAAAPAEYVNKAKQPPTPGAGAKLPLTAEQKRKVVVLTTFVIAGIVTILLLLFAWMFWWSRRTHRLLREPLPAANRGDELWYLKAKRPPSTSEGPTPESPPAPPSN